MKNQIIRNAIIGLLLVCFCGSSLIGCGTSTSTDSSASAESYSTSASTTHEISSANSQNIPSIVSTLNNSVASSALAGSKSSVTSTRSSKSSSQLSSTSSSQQSTSVQSSSSISQKVEEVKRGPVPLTTPKKRMATNGMGVFACLDDKGKLYKWGTDSSILHTSVDLPPLVDVALGQDYGVGLDANGKLYSWGNLGRNDFGQTQFGDNLPPFVEVEASAYQTAALTADGVLYKWGNTNKGDQKSVPQNLGKVKSVAVDAYITGAVTSENKVVSWGVSPRNVFSSTYSMVSCSHYDAFALGIDGKVYGSFTLLDGQMQAIQPPSVSNIIKISGSIALDSNGKVFVWGANKLYSHEEITDLPVNLPKIVDIAGSGNNGMALGENGKIYTWGLGVEKASQATYDFLNSEPNVYADDPVPENTENMTVNTYAQLQSAVANPLCKTITIDGNIAISVNLLNIQKDLTVAKGSTLTIEASAGNIMVYGKLTVDGYVLVKGRLIVLKESNVIVTGSIIKQGSGKVSTYLTDITQLENLLKSNVINDIMYTPGNPINFTFDKDMTIPSGKSVWFNINVTIIVNTGVTLTVNGLLQTYNTPVVLGTVVGNIVTLPKS